MLRRRFLGRGNTPKRHQLPNYGYTATAYRERPVGRGFTTPIEMSKIFAA